MMSPDKQTFDASGVSVYRFRLSGNDFFDCLQRVSAEQSPCFSSPANLLFAPKIAVCGERDTSENDFAKGYKGVLIC